MNDLQPLLNKIKNTVSQEHYIGLVPSHLTADIAYMQKLLDKKDNMGAYFVYGTIVRKLINIGKPSDIE